MAEKDHEEDETRNQNWAKLTYECLTNILSRLSLEERWTGPMFVCKSWIHACKDPCFFSVVDLESIFYSKTESSLWWSPEFERKIDSLLISVVNWSGGINIKEIRIRHCSDESLSFHVGIVPNEYLNACLQDGNVEATAIGKFMPNLEHLELRFSKLTYRDLCGCSNFTSRDIENASTNLKNMKRLEIPTCYVPRDVFPTERYGHWRLYDERFQPSSFHI
ncbi:hypothetical protein MKW98_003097 [Papaver atlanticum]|uniref:F-box domain-containing protein n=1 Tax=Papaver atlanticum TaxID=357466 RepID=A0AAD4XY27_9MAGN|nr:hypothetical protein MKW98_003097 [Papaver atlanticum]